jgi:hypothetical protein
MMTRRTKPSFSRIYGLAVSSAPAAIPFLLSSDSVTGIIAEAVTKRQDHTQQNNHGGCLPKTKNSPLKPPDHILHKGVRSAFDCCKGQKLIPLKNIFVVDIQDRISYTYPHKTMLIINISKKTLTMLCTCRGEVHYTGKGNYCMTRRTTNEI